MTADFATPGAAPARAGLARIPLARGELWFAERWLPPDAADALLADLVAQVPWEVHRIRLFGRMVDSPRLSCWIGDPEATYVYSGARFEPRPWPAALLPVRELLAR